MIKSIKWDSLNHTNLFWISLVHLVSLFALFDFSWTGLGLVMVGTFLLAPLGINVGYHRLLSHRSFSTSALFRNFLATLGATLGAGPPIHWAAMHRVHHRYSE